MPNPSQNPTPPANRETERRRRAIEADSARVKREAEARKTERERRQQAALQASKPKTPERHVFDPKNV